MKTKLLLLLIMLFSFFVVVNSQETETEESSVVSVPENAMREVVRRILVYNFKPRTRKKVIFISQEGIKQGWLPKIQNIEFRLLTDGEIEDKGKDIYFFTKSEIAKSTYEIGFALGDPNCEYFGRSWKFRPTKSKVKLWLANYGIGGGCSSTSLRDVSNQEH